MPIEQQVALFQVVACQVFVDQASEKTCDISN